MPELDLNQIGVLEGTDKSSSVLLKWDYLRHYEKVFAAWKDKSINFIEIGVANGNSLGVWKELFTTAQIIGVDINPECAKFAGDRIKIEIGSQDDPEFLARLCSKYEPTIIVDDGSHLAHHIIYTFEHMFPFLAPGGIYVVEDLDFHFGEEASKWAPISGYSPPNYFLELTQCCMTRKHPKELWGAFRNIVNATDSVCVINSAVFVQKKEIGQRGIDLPAAKQYIGKKSMPINALLNYLEYMVDNGANLDEIIAELKKIQPIECSVRTFKLLAELQRRAGNFDDAIETLAAGAKQFPHDCDLLWRFGHWLCDKGEHKNGIRIMGEAAGFSNNVGTVKQIVSMVIVRAQKHDEVAAARDALRKSAKASTGDECRRVLTDGVSALGR